MPATYDKIGVVIANGSANTYTFSSIPQTYNDLVLIINTINSQSGGNVSIRFNGDSSGNYSRTFFYGDGTTAVSGRDTNSGSMLGGATHPNGAYVAWDIFNYISASTNKTVLEQHIEASRLVAAQVGLWRNTSAAISTIEVTTQTALNSGQVITLYGIKAA